MKASRILSSCALSVSMVCLLLIGGCLVSEFTLFDPASGKVDKKFVGDWDSTSFNAEGRGAGLIVRNIDDKNYYVEWRQREANATVVRAVAQIAEVKGVAFAQMRGLEADGAIDDKWLICRLQVDGDQLTIRNLKKEFFDGKQIDSSQKLRQTIENNLDNAEMYAQDEQIVATRVAGK